jgi:hypothetical protein
MNLSAWAVSNSDVTSRLRRLEGSYPKQKSATPVFSKSKFVLPSSTAVTPTGQINPLSAVQAKGNLSPFVLSGSLGFIASSTSITVFWDGTNSSVPIVVKRADKTSFTVPKGAQTIGNLQPGTQYLFSVYWNVNNTSGLSFGPGDVGSPRIAVSPGASQATTNAALQAQQTYNAEPIYAGLVAFSTTASGQSSGAGKTPSGIPFSPVRVRGFNAQ